jgi:prepilin-type N-terminal cleavage/methylation domain-containing protein
MKGFSTRGRFVCAVRRRAFTLIELLVVIAIVVILISITMPAIGRARESSRRTKCLVNLKSIGTGLQMYMDTEGRGMLPKVRPLNDGANENDPSLLDVMARYTTAALPYRPAPGEDWVCPEPWKCPSDRDSGDAASGNKPLHQITGTSYEYTPAFVMVAAETLTVRNVQHGVSRAFENFNPPLPVIIDADNWHNPRFAADRRADLPQDVVWDRNAVFYGDWHAGKAPYFGEDTIVRLVVDTIRYGGGLGG